MKKVLLIICGVFIAWTARATDTCVRTALKVEYSCGNGTLVGTLPANGTVEYGASFTPTTITTDMCTPPDGTNISGISIYSGQELLASGPSASLKNYFTTDITITPHYINTATIEELANNVNVAPTSFTSDPTTMTWQAVFPYGVVNGIARCYWEAAIETIGYIPIDQDAIENHLDNPPAYNYFIQCYCKMTEPYVENSPWVFQGNMGAYAYGPVDGTNTTCANCAIRCASFQKNNVSLRTSLFSAAIEEVHKQNSQ